MKHLIYWSICVYKVFLIYSVRQHMWCIHDSRYQWIAELSDSWSTQWESIGFNLGVSPPLKLKKIFMDRRLAHSVNRPTWWHLMCNGQSLPNWSNFAKCFWYSVSQAHLLAKLIRLPNIIIDILVWKWMAHWVYSICDCWWCIFQISIGIIRCLSRNCTGPSNALPIVN